MVTFSQAAAPRSRDLLRIAGVSDEVQLDRIEVALAADRPDRLEVEFEIGAKGTPTLAAYESMAPGRDISIETIEGCLFDGVVDSRSLRFGDPDDDSRDGGGGGAFGSFVAFARYESRREALSAREVYYQSTDAEIARRVADALGLRAEVDPGDVVHDRIVREGDPLRFLRVRARDSDTEFAVSDGTLWFSSRLRSPRTAVSPSSEFASERLGVARRVSVGDRVLSLSVDDNSRGGRGGEIVLAGDSSWRPLEVFDLLGFGPADGAYRVVRAVHRRSASEGFLTTLLFLEYGVDWERFQGDAGGAP